MQALLERCWDESCHLHVGDLAWQWALAGGGRPDWPIEVWKSADGTVEAWGWLQDGHLHFAVDPARLELVPEILAWAKDRARALATSVLDVNAELVAALRAAGFAAAPDDAPFSFHLRCELAKLGESSLPREFTVRAVEPDEVESRVDVHRRAWSLLPFAAGSLESRSSLTSDGYRQMMSTWPYRAELDCVVEAAAGALVACACGWLDERNGVVELEPVGTVAEYRGRGLAGAACLGVLRAARELGARTGLVYARGDSAYPAPLRAYSKLGFVPYARTRTFHSAREEDRK